MFSLGCFEILILLGIVIIIARLARLEGRRDFRWLWDKFLLLLRRARRLSGVKLIFTSLLVGLLFVLVLTALIGTGARKTLANEILVGSLFWSAILLFIWGLVRLIFRDARWADCPPIGLLKDFLAERLSLTDRRRLAAHLEGCTAC